eukprot:CAMPEP_0113504482 /NCGR_PEP_ID=MMETSP0014_2-20120614/34739_1 /TAXON_ID=2857 /ORGANISM="Nitzschia sp." /LENGTH=649 /DNA_ID=CAMNT_0000399595 /DNA_START=45 /DNA_END=1994 /DNA_ORIENTATION=- /assembly_acc=CAM_ASM_000159
MSNRRHLFTRASGLVVVLFICLFSILATLFVVAGPERSTRQPQPQPQQQQQQQQEYQQEEEYFSSHHHAHPHHPRRRPPPPQFSSSSSSSSSPPPPPRTSSSRPQSQHRALQTTVDGAQSVDGQLRALLMEGYDRNAFPWNYVWELQQNSTTTTEANTGPFMRQGLNVDVGLNFHKVHQLNVAESTADLVAWVRIAWNDPRLRWDPNEFGNLTKTWFFVEQGMGGNEASEIWTPDIVLWNQEEPLHKTLEDAYATVQHTGDVFWSRPGRIKSTCKYRGLDRFPFDALQCMMEFGSWTKSGLYVRPSKLDGIGYSIGGSTTAGQAFAEFELTSVDCDELVYPPFISAPEEDWPVLIYELTFERASEPYVRGYVLLQIFLNLCAFACFWIPPHVGERMGLAITSLLAAVASELTISARLPAAGEFTWFVIFSMSSMIFSVAVVFESTAVIYFYYYTGSDLDPSYIKWMKTTWKARQKKKRRSEKSRRGTIDRRSTQAENGSTIFRKNATHSATGEDADGDIDVDATAHASNTGVKTPTDSKERTDNSTHVKFSEDMKEQSNHSANDSLDHQLTPPRVFKLQDGNMDGSFNQSESFRMKRDADDFDDEIARLNNARWQKVSVLIDEYCRVLFLISYGVFLAIVFARRGNDYE